MERPDEVWKTEDLSKTFLEGVRAAIPLSAVQADVMVRIIEAVPARVESFLDLGCGDGILGRAILERHPGARATFLDFSEPMIQRARECLSGGKYDAECALADFASPLWIAAVTERAPFDVVVSGYAIHHQPDERKKALYAEIYDLLTPGGVFLNVEHVASNSEWAGRINDELFIDSLLSFHQGKDPSAVRDEIAEAFFNRSDKEANILAPVEEQCRWLRDVGFGDVDCFFKLFELAVFGGVR